MIGPERHTDDLAARTDALSGGEEHGASPGSHIQHPISRCYPGNLHQPSAGMREKRRPELGIVRGHLSV